MSDKISIDGLILEKANDYIIATITELSEEFKNIIRNRFSAICHGEQNSLLNRGSYTYERTIEEFLKRVRSKDVKTQTGMTKVAPSIMMLYSHLF